MGRAGSYIDTVIRKARVPTVDTAAAIADVCGCDLRLVDRATGETVATVEPPARPGAAG